MERRIVISGPADSSVVQFSRDCAINVFLLYFIVKAILAAVSDVNNRCRRSDLQLLSDWVSELGLDQIRMSVYSAQGAETKWTIRSDREKSETILYLTLL